ncbi:MAG TPA: zinc-ribbon domain-containing protein [Nitrososphaera sp.]|nr:zinc-ribbon domain-containing protein [Nitrososphaera sp.]
MRFSGDERIMRMEESGDPMPGRGAPFIIADKACSKCGTSNPRESAFCTKCGRPLN